MRAENVLQRLLVISLLVCSAFAVAHAQSSRAGDDEFGPNVSAYLKYLQNEREVVDDRASRREIKRSYYVRNLNRINALRHMAVQIARATGNDYLPELEAVSQDELAQLFDAPPSKPSALKVGELLEYKFRFLGVVASGREGYGRGRRDERERTRRRTRGARRRAST